MVNNKGVMIKCDYISQALSQGYAYTKREEQKNITWDDFNNKSKGKKLYLFGTGNGLKHFVYYYHTKYTIEGIIDNSLEKIATPISDYMWDFCTNRITEKKVLSPDVLKNESKNDVIILVTCLKAFEEIADQLSQIGIHNYFSLLCLEKNNTRNHALKKYNTENSMVKEVLEGTSIVPQRVVFYLECFIDHGLYITEELKKRECEIVWIINDYVDIVSDIKQILIGNECAVIEALETANIVVSSVILPPYYIKRSKQAYIQIKHWGSVTLKKFFLDVEYFKSMQETIQGWKQEGEKIDYIITGSDFDANTCKSGFGFDGKCMMFGSCRSDAMFKPGRNYERIKHYTKTKERVRFLLYAPTYRWMNNKGFERKVQEYIPDLTKCKEAVKRWGGEWVILLRLHPSISDKVSALNISSDVIDVSSYEDGQGLVAACDAMITDYSSIMFEMAYVNKPVFLFAPDYEEYVKNDYEFLIDYKTLPFPISNNTEELEDAIKNFDREKYEKGVTEFLDKYGVHEDGHASKRTADFIISLLEKDK